MIRDPNFERPHRGRRIAPGPWDAVIVHSDDLGSASQPLPPLVVVVGTGTQQPRQLERLMDDGAVVLMASTPEAAQAWISHATASPSADPGHKEAIRFGSLEIDRDEHQARWEGTALPLSEREIALLSVLADASGRACSFGELTIQAWKEPDVGHHDPMRSAVKRLRKKLSAAGAGLAIESVPGFGFRLTEHPS